MQRFIFSLTSKKPRQINTPRIMSLHARPSTGDQLEQVFDYFDEDGDGMISPAELRNRMRVAGEELPIEGMEALVQSTDTDGDGLLGFDDFVKLVEVEGEEEKGKNLREVFRVYEMDDCECITPRSLRRALSKLGDNKSVDECAAMIRRFDLNRDGVISFEEFKNMMG